ncbi:MAG: heme-binding domain-containing protein [Bryobacteraceae bacterium]
MVKWIVLAAVLIGVIIQFVQPERSNPPTEPGASYEAIARPAPELAAVLRHACYDCHSNQTAWPWYSRISPVSWLIARDVKRGRAHLNFSEWNRYSPDAARRRIEEACEEVREGNMPLKSYRLMHRGARLGPREADLICQAPPGR